VSLDDDDDFAASFVLSRGEVDAALAAERPDSETTTAAPKVTAPSRTYLYAGIAAAVLLLFGALAWFAL